MSARTQHPATSPVWRWLLAPLVLLTMCLPALGAADSGQWVVPTAAENPSGLWMDPTLAYDGSSASYAADHSNAAGDGPWLILDYAPAIHTNQVLLTADYGYDIVDGVSLEALVQDTWVPLFSGAIDNDSAFLISFPSITAEAFRFRFHYLSNGYYFWLYDFRAYSQPAQVILPQVVTSPATAVTDVSAVLHGQITSDGGALCSVAFQYRPTSSSTVVTTGWTHAVTTGQGASAVLLPIAGLQAGVPYVYHITVQNSAGTVHGDDVFFTPQPIVAGSGEWMPGIDVHPAATTEMCWVNAASAIDDDRTTAAGCYHPLWASQWSPNLTISLPQIAIDHVRLSAGLNPYIDAIAVEIQQNDGAWMAVYQGAFTDQDWQEYTLAAAVYPQARVRIHTTTTGVGTTLLLNEFQVRTPFLPPVITVAPDANPRVVTGTTTTLAVTATDPAGGALTYLWSADAGSPAAVTFASPAAESTTATFTAPGTYPLSVIVTNVAGLSITGTVHVVVSAAPATLAIDPASATVVAGQTQTFSASATDQFGQPLVVAVTWSVTGSGSIDQSGVFTAGATGISATVSAQSAGLQAQAVIAISPAAPVEPPPAPTVTVAIIDGLTGDQHGTVAGEAVHFTNRNAITVSLHAAGASGTTVDDFQVTATAGSVTMTGPTTWSLTDLPEGRIELGGRATAHRDGSATTGTTASPVVVLVDRTVPSIELLEPGSEADPQPLGVGLVSAQGRPLLLNQAPDNAALRSRLGWRCWSVDGLIIPARVTDASGLDSSTAPTATVGSAALTIALGAPATDGSVPLSLSGFEALPEAATPDAVSLALTTGVGMQPLHLRMTDRCGNVQDVDLCSVWKKTQVGKAAFGYVPFQRSGFPTEIGVIGAQQQSAQDPLWLLVTSADIVAVDQHDMTAWTHPCIGSAEKLTPGLSGAGVAIGQGPVLWRLPVPVVADHLGVLKGGVRMRDAAGNVTALADLEPIVTSQQTFTFEPPAAAEFTSTLTLDDLNVSEPCDYERNYFDYEYWFQTSPARLPWRWVTMYDMGDYWMPEMLSGNWWMKTDAYVWYTGQVATEVRHRGPVDCAIGQQLVDGSSFTAAYIVGPSDVQEIDLSAHADDGVCYAAALTTSNGRIEGQGFIQTVTDPTTLVAVSKTRPASSAQTVPAWIPIGGSVGSGEQLIVHYLLGTCAESTVWSGDIPSATYAWDRISDTDYVIASAPASWSGPRVSSSSQADATRGLVQFASADLSPVALSSGANGRLEVPLTHAVPGGYARVQWEKDDAADGSTYWQHMGFRGLNVVKVPTDVLATGDQNLTLEGGFFSSLSAGNPEIPASDNEVRLLLSSRRQWVESRLHAPSAGGVLAVGDMQRWLDDVAVDAQADLTAVAQTDDGPANAEQAKALVLRSRELRLAMDAALQQFAAPSCMERYRAIRDGYAGSLVKGLLANALPEAQLQTLVDAALTAREEAGASEQAAGELYPQQAGSAAFLAAAQTAFQKRMQAAQADFNVLRFLVDGFTAFGNAVEPAIAPYRASLTSIDDQFIQYHESAVSAWNDFTGGWFESPFTGEQWNALFDQRDAILRDPDYIDIMSAQRLGLPDSVLRGMDNRVASACADRTKRSDDMDLDSLISVGSQATAPADADWALRQRQSVQLHIGAGAAGVYDIEVRMGGVHAKYNPPVRRTKTITTTSAVVFEGEIFSVSEVENEPIVEYQARCAAYASAHAWERDNAGANGAHRMKEALAVVSIGFETETSAGGYATELKKSYSLPKITMGSWASGNVSVNASTGMATVSVSGEVHDDAASLYPTSALKSVHVYRGDSYLGSLSLSAESDQTTDWKPYAKHFTFSGSVQMQAWDGEHELAIMTDPNEMGARGVASARVTVSAAFPNPVLTNKVEIIAADGFRPDAIDSIQLKDPINIPGSAQGVASAVLIETGMDTKIFSGSSGYQVSVMVVTEEEIQAIIANGGQQIHEGWFQRNGWSYAMTSYAWKPITSPTVFSYRADWSGPWSDSQADNITLALPEHLVGVSAAPMSLVETSANSRMFSGTLGTTPISASFVGSGTMTMSVNVGGYVVGSAQVTADIGSAGTAQVSRTLTKDGPQYELGSVGSLATINRTNDWEPYRVRITGPEAVMEKFIQDRSWTHNGAQFEVFKKDDAYFLKGADNKAQICIDPVDVLDSPSRAAGGSTYAGNDNPKNDGTAKFVGELPAGNLRITAVIPAQDVEGEDSINVTATITPDRRNVQAIIPKRNGWEYSHAFTKLVDPAVDALVVAGALARDKAQALAEHVAGVPNTVDLGSAPMTNAEIAKIKPDRIVVWKWANNQETGSNGWVYNLDELDGLSDRIPLWTLPPASKNGSAEFSLSSCIVMVVKGPDVQLQNEQERFVVQMLGGKVYRGEINHWSETEAKTVFEWMIANVFDPDAPKTKTLLKPKYIKDREFDISKALDECYQEKMSIFQAAEAKRKQIATASVVRVDWSKMAEAQTYLNTIGVITSLGDPFAWASVLGGGSLLTITEGATWAAVAIDGGFLAVDFIPGGKLVTKGAKKLKGIFCLKRVESISSLPKAEKAVQETAERVAKKSRLWTKPNEAVFWSGRSNSIPVNGAGSQVGNGFAKGFASTYDGKTLEMVLKERGIDSSAFKAADWDLVSKELAESASGVVRVVLGKDSFAGATTWGRIEWPAIKNGLETGRVTKVLAIVVDDAEQGLFHHKEIFVDAVFK